MATSSTNLGLRKPEGADFVSVALDISGNMQTLDDKWAVSTPAPIGNTLAPGSSLTVARSDHVHNVASGTALLPGLAIGEITSGLYRGGAGVIGATISAVKVAELTAAGLAIEQPVAFKHIASPTALAGYAKLYAKSDNKLYKMSSAGVEVVMLDGTAASVPLATLAHVGANNVLRSNGTANIGGQVVNADIAPLTIRGGVDGAAGRIAAASINAADIAPRTITGAAVGTNMNIAFQTIYGGQAGVNSNIAPASILGTDLVTATLTATQILPGTIPRVLISRTALPAPVGGFDLLQIPTAYKNLHLNLLSRTNGAAAVEAVGLRLSSDPSGTPTPDSATTYGYQILYAQSGTAAGSPSAASTYIQIGYITGASASANFFGQIRATLLDSAGTYCKTVLAQGGAVPTQASTTSSLASTASGFWLGTGAVRQIRLFPLGGSAFVAGTIIELWGEY